jgi:hypothetical protein
VLSRVNGCVESSKPRCSFRSLLRGAQVDHLRASGLHASAATLAKEANLQLPGPLGVVGCAAPQRNRRANWRRDG